MLARLEKLVCFAERSQLSRFETTIAIEEACTVVFLQDINERVKSSVKCEPQGAGESRRWFPQDWTSSLVDGLATSDFCNLVNALQSPGDQLTWLSVYTV